MHNIFPIFVYGTLMKGERAFSLLAPYSLRYAAATLRCVQLYASPEGYPYAAEQQGEDGDALAILGEVHWLRSDGYEGLLARLDRYEGDEYTRQRRHVRLVQHHTVDRPGEYAASTDEERWVEAWVYLSEYVYAARYPLIPSGNWRTWRQEW